MDEDRVVVTNLERELADGFEKRQALDVAGRAANLGDDHIGPGLLTQHVHALLDLVSHVWDNLHGLAEVFPLAFVIEDRLIHLTARQVVKPRQLHAGKPLVMAQVEVRLRAVVEHIDFAVLERAHRARIDVEVRVELLQGDLQAAVFQQRAQRSRRQALAQRAHHTARNKYVFHGMVDSYLG